MGDSKKKWKDDVEERLEDRRITGGMIKERSQEGLVRAETWIRVVHSTQIQSDPILVTRVQYKSRYKP